MQVEAKRGPWPAATVEDLVIREADCSKGLATRILRALAKIGVEQMSPADFAAVYDQQRLLAIVGCGESCVAALVAALKNAGYDLPRDGRGTRREQDARAAALVARAALA